MGNDSGQIKEVVILEEIVKSFICLYMAGDSCQMKGSAGIHCIYYPLPMCSKYIVCNWQR